MSLPEPLTSIPEVRRERQCWHRLDRAEGELDVGYDETGRPVRVEYHWLRLLSRADPGLADVYTAELWVRQPDGSWLYLLRPQETAFHRVGHEEVRAVFRRHLNLDAGE